MNDFDGLSVFIERIMVGALITLVDHKRTMQMKLAIALAVCNSKRREYSMHGFL